MLLASMVALLTLESAGATSGYAKACLVGDNLNTTVRFSCVSLCCSVSDSLTECCRAHKGLGLR